MAAEADIQSPGGGYTAKPAAERAEALDATRGFAILAMVLSGVISYGVLPAWMYHAQIPPPSHAFNPDLPGLTWVDLVFPLFLFSLGAAIPFALSRRLDRGLPPLHIIAGIIERAFLLGFFAIFLRHVRPHVLNPTPGRRDWLIALLGFALMFPLFSRLPSRWPFRTRLLLKGSGWVAALALLLWLRYPDGSGFSLYRSDIILIVLANAAFFAPLIWISTRRKPLLRLGIVALLVALRLGSGEPGWVQWLWNASPLPWLYRLYYLQYLCIVIPGTVVGDLLLRQQSTGSRGEKRGARHTLLLVSASLILLTALVGLQARWLWGTAALTVILCASSYLAVAGPAGSGEGTLKALVAWGSYWLILGLLLEPFEGGIKKDHSTLSYYFVTTGLSIFILLLFTLIIDIFKKERATALLSRNGQNPMIAYVAFANFIWPLLALTGAEKLISSITAAPGLGFVRGVLYTTVLSLLVCACTERRIFWRT